MNGSDTQSGETSGRVYPPLGSKKDVLSMVVAFSLLLAVGCEYAPYPEGEPTNYEDCIQKSTKDFTSSDPARAKILTEKACKQKFGR